MHRVGVVMGGLKVTAEPIADAPPEVARMCALLMRMLAGHGGRVEPAFLDGVQCAALTVEMPGANPLIVTVTQP